MADRFSQLPNHLLEYLLEFITKRLDLDDLIRFSCVCQRWKSFSSPLLPPKNLPWLIVPYGDYFSKKGTIFNQTLGFFSIHTRKLYKVESPEIANRRICGSCKGGWLITLHGNGEIQLLHPFSKSLINLPPVTELPGVVGSIVTKENRRIYRVPVRSGDTKLILSSHMREFYIYKGIMSSSCPTSGIVMVIHGISRKLAFCRPRNDKKWILVEGGDSCNFEDVILYRGEFYAVQDKGHVFVVCGLDSSSPFLKLVLYEPDKYGYYKKHLVEVNEELLLLRRVRYEFEPGDAEAHITLAFVIKKIDLSESMWVNIEEIDKHSALFVGVNDSFTLSTLDVPQCKGNHIYFTDDCLEQFVSDHLENYAEETFGGHDIGIYGLKDGDFDRFYLSTTKLVKPPPVWFSTSSY